MKNIHVLPTDKPSNLLLCIKDYTEHKDTPAENSDTKGNFRLGLGIYANTEVYQYKNIYITSDEEIKMDDWCFEIYNGDSKANSPKFIDIDGNIWWLRKANANDIAGCPTTKKIILTTDQDLIKDGVQSIDDEFLEWFVKNPSCEVVEIEDWYNKFLSCCRSKKECHCNKKRIIIPKESLTKITDNWDGTETLSPSDPNFGKIIIPKEEPKYISIIEKMKPLQEQWQKDMDESLKPKQETLEEYIERETKGLIEPNLKAAAKAFIRYGAKWQAEKTCESEFIQLIRATKSDAEARRIIREYFK